MARVVETMVKQIQVDQVVPYAKGATRPMMLNLQAPNTLGSCLAVHTNSVVCVWAVNAALGTVKGFGVNVGQTVLWLPCCSSALGRSADRQKVLRQSRPQRRHLSGPELAGQRFFAKSDGTASSAGSRHESDLIYQLLQSKHGG